MERTEGLLGGKFLFKSKNDGTINKTKVACGICQAECSYHRSSSSLSYHLNAKHPTESSPRFTPRLLQENTIPRHHCVSHTFLVCLRESKEKIRLNNRV